MKIFTVIAIVCYLFVTTNSLPTGSASDDVVEKCSKCNNVSLEEARKLVRHAKQASNDNEKCLLRCYLEEKGYFVNGKVDFDKLLQLHKNFESPSQHEKLEKLFKECEATVDYKKDNCDVAYQVYKCAEGNET